MNRRENAKHIKNRDIAQRIPQERQHRRQPISKTLHEHVFFISSSSLCPSPPCRSFSRRPVIISRLTGRSLIYDLPKAKLNFPPVIYTFWHFDLPSERELRFSSNVTPCRLIRRVADHGFTGAIISMK